MGYLEEKVLIICKKYYKPLLDKYGVVGIGLGFKKINNVYTSEPCLHVLVNLKIPKKFLSTKNIIPKTFLGVKTDVIAVGNVHEYSDLLTDRVRPLIGGYCIMSGNTFTGTMACIVTRHSRTSTDYFILGNNHVLAGRNTLKMGAPVIQPSTKFGGDPTKDIVATLTKYIPIKNKTPFFSPTNYVDCAIAKILDINNISNKIALEGPIKGVASSSLGEKVSKIGMSTGLTNGYVRSVGVTATIPSSDGKHLAIYKDITRADFHTEPGDSGAIVINNSTKAVGLFFSGSPGNVAFFCSMSRCLNELGVELYTGQNILSQSNNCNCICKC